MSFVSYAQNREDVMLWRALRQAGPGFYIDVGAADPDELSVSRAFYERGWRGINIEPLDKFHQRLAAARPDEVNLQVAVSDSEGEQSFWQVGRGRELGLSTLDGALARAHAAEGQPVEERRVPVTTLAAICRAHVRGEIQFLKLDVEGAERAALAGADFAAFRPWIVLVESTRPMSEEPTHEAWEPILTGAGYRFVWFDGLNRFYVAEEHFEALAPAFRTPPNVFDDYSVHDPRIAALGAEAGRLRAVAERTREALDRARERQRAAQVEIQRLQEENAWLAGVRAALEAERDKLAAERNAIVAQSKEYALKAETLDRLAAELRWDNAPGALGRVLPLARAIRRLRGLRRRQAAGPDQAPALPPMHTLSELASFDLSLADRLENRLHARADDLRAGLQALLDRPAPPPASAVVTPETIELFRSIESLLLTLALERPGS